MKALVIWERDGTSLTAPPSLVGVALTPAAAEVAARASTPWHERSVEEVDVIGPVHGDPEDEWTRALRAQVIDDLLLTGVEATSRGIRWGIANDTLTAWRDAILRGER